MTHEMTMTRKMSTTNETWSRSHSPEAKIGCRHVQILLLLLGFLCCFAIRVVPSIGLVAMTKSSAANSNFKDYDWSHSIQNLILSSYLWGSIATQILAGVLAQRFGAQKLVSFAVGMCGFLTILIPAAARYGGWQAFLAIRIFTGVVQGFVPPCIYIILSKWVPVVERGRAGSSVYSGGLLGNVIGLLSSGAIAKSVLGWPSCFYIWGGTAIFWAILYQFIGKQSPSLHPTISPDEKEYIEASLGVTDIVKRLKTPWTAIFTSIPVWALLVTQCAHSWGAWMLLTQIPKYMTHVLGFNILENGIVSAVPYLVACLLSFPISYFCDKIVKNGYVSLTPMRKIANSIGLFVPAVSLIGFSYVNNGDRTVAVVILVLSMGFNVFICSGFLINHVDLSPNFSGILIGITHTVANIFGIMAPLICGVIVPDVTNIYQWRKMFFLSAGVYILGNTVFVLFGDAKVQPWNESTADPQVDNVNSLGSSAAVTSVKTAEEREI